MPDRLLPDQVEARLATALESGAPLSAPLPSQARYAGLLARAMPAPLWRVRVLTVAVAVAGVFAIAFAAPPQPRTWLAQSVGQIAHDVGVPAAAASPSPAVRESPEARESPAPTESPEAHEGTSPVESPEPSESAGSGASQDGDHPEPSPTGGEHRDGGGDSSPQPSPQPSPSGGD